MASTNKPSKTTPTNPGGQVKPVVIRFNPQAMKRGDVIAHVVLQED